MSAVLRRVEATRPALRLFRVIPGFCMVLFGAGLPPRLWPTESVRLKLLYSIPISQEHQAVLEDVSPHGLVLLNATGDMYSDLPDFNHPKLLLWDPDSRRVAVEIPLAKCVKRRKSLGTVLQRGRLGPFRFVGDGTHIVGIQSPWIILIDTRSKEEVFHRLPSPAPLSGASTSETGTGMSVLAVSPRRRRVAVVLNRRSRPYLNVYQADLRGQGTNWQLEGPVQHVCWSPDENALAVLYSGARDLQGGYISRRSKSWAVGTLPNIEILEARRGRRLLAFSTGDVETKIEFSRNGKDLYTIRAGLCAACKDVKRDAIRVFSAIDGRLVRTFRVAGTGVRDSFELSPDGQLLVANASSAWMFLGLMIEASWTKSDGRFVLMDAQNGQILFRHHERTWNRGAPFKFAFSRDGKLLFADSNCNVQCPDGERVEVYSVSGQRGASG